MSWHYLQEQEEACWLPACLDGAPDALLSLIPTPDESSSRDNATDASNGSRYGMTSRPSTVDRGEGFFAKGSSAGDSPVSTSPRRVAVEASPERVRDSFSRCCELLARFDLALSSLKTVRAFVPMDSAPSSRDLPAWGISHDGACWELGTSARVIGAIECGSYLPTPTAQRYGTNVGGAAGRTGKVRESLDTMARRAGGRLSPAFTEAMMIWPIGWTDLEPLAMDRFREWLLSHGIF